MKKSFALGAAALAAIVMAAPQDADASEIKVGGYYMFRMQDTDDTVADRTNFDNRRAWYHRIQLNTDFIHDKKTHAHYVLRLMDSTVVQGADAPGLGCNTNVAGCDATLNVGGGTTLFAEKMAWLETDLWGVGLKVGNMPIELNDSILIGTDTTGFGTIMLSKTFGDITAVAANVRVREGNVRNLSSNAGVGMGADEDDENLYVLSLFGKLDVVDYNATVAYYRAEQDSTIGLGSVSGGDVDDSWFALTLHRDFGVIDATGTLIYESGMDDFGASPNMPRDSGFLAAVRAKGDVSFGEWNAYGFWASKDFTNISNDNMGWSKTWDMGGPGGRDLMSTWAAAAGTSPSENMAGIGAGLKIKVNGWTVNPMIDYASVVEEDYFAPIGVADYNTDSALGGTLQVSTKLNKATTLYLTGIFVNPDENVNNTVNNLHTVEASVRMNF